MFLLLVPCVAFGLSAGQDTKLQVVNPRATYGHLGAVRPKDAGILPGDVVHFTFDIKNLKFDESGVAQYSVGIEIRDGKGGLFYEQKPYNAVTHNFFGGNTLPCSASVDIPLDTAPGNFHWRVTIQDRLANTSVQVEGTRAVLKPAFGLVRVGTFADAEGRAPKAPIGVVGSTLYINFSAVGFGRDAKSKKPDVQVEMRVLDDKGKPTLAKALSGQVKEDISEKARLVPLQFGLTLNRAGHFSIELTARCKHSGATSKVTIPVRILAME